MLLQHLIYSTHEGGRGTNSDRDRTMSLKQVVTVPLPTAIDVNVANPSDEIIKFMRTFTAQ